MIIGDAFWKQLSPEVQAVIKDAAIKAGRKERQATIDDGEAAKARLIAEGVNIHKITPEEKSEWKQKTQVVYEKFTPTFTPGLIDQIKNA
jgi:TRAP-type C4-dicarboxylate transport system substrate-binding protein